MDEAIEVVAVLRGKRVLAHDDESKVVVAETLLEVAAGRCPFSYEPAEVEGVEQERTFVGEHCDHRICRKITSALRQELPLYRSHRGSRRQRLRSQGRNHRRDARKGK